MPNPYFQFKKFIIRQDRCAMKVCTDSCILGAWTASRLSGSKKILDIGTGTGLLSLMLAQKSEAQIMAIESDRESFAQAGENIRESEWAGRIQLLEDDAKQFPFKSEFDFIITNPPFFESDLLSPHSKKNKAKHHESLTLEELVLILQSALLPEGRFSILLPFHRNAYFEKLAAENGYYLLEKIIIRQTPMHLPFRTVGLYGSQQPAEIISGEMNIKNAEGKNSLEFSAIMQDYYG